MSEHDRLETEARSGSAAGEVDPSGASEQVSESLDDDKLSVDFPPDEPMAVDDYGTTPQEQRVPEPIDERVEREQPETETAGEPDRVGQLVDPDEGDLRDTERDAVADEVREVPGHDRPVGDVGTGEVTTEEIASGSGPEMQPDQSAEEAAVHQRPGP
jgi:hypothetical protein